MNEQPGTADYLLSIVIPVYNEEQGASECVRRVSKVIEDKIGCRYELIFVNDGSRDRTLDILKEEKEKNPHVKIVDLSRNFGHQAAITAGIDQAHGDAVIVIDGDLQDPPEIFPQLIEKWKNGADIVHARRLVRHGESQITKVRAAIFYRVMRQISTIDIPVDVGDFRLMSKRVVDELKGMTEQRRYVRGLATWVGYNQETIGYEREARFAGTPSYTLKTLIDLAMSGILGFSIEPLRLGWYSGLLTVAISFVMLAYWLLTHESAPNWAPLMVALLFIGGLQLICIGIIGEYVFLILDCVRKRPVYIVRDIY
ncbi:MAG: glycosyltransferase family 2 protein [Candidatus Melainabacteria bacterium]|nr:glycosyltransferase family 2 protein [Candidatus Melainabacteria bacterium]